MTQYSIGRVELTGYEFGVLEGMIDVSNEEYDKIEKEFLAKARELTNRGLRDYARKPMKVTAVQWDGTDNSLSLIELLMRPPFDEVRKSDENTLEIHSGRSERAIFDVPLDYYVYEDQRGNLGVQCPENFEQLFEEVND